MITIYVDGDALIEKVKKVGYSNNFSVEEKEVDSVVAKLEERGIFTKYQEIHGLIILTEDTSKSAAKKTEAPKVEVPKVTKPTTVEKKKKEK